jgi:hypothetical protein
LCFKIFIEAFIAKPLKCSQVVNPKLWYLIKFFFRLASLALLPATRLIWLIIDFYKFSASLTDKYLVPGYVAIDQNLFQFFVTKLDIFVDTDIIEQVEGSEFHVIAQESTGFHLFDHIASQVDFPELFVVLENSFSELSDFVGLKIDSSQFLKASSLISAMLLKGALKVSKNPQFSKWFNSCSLPSSSGTYWR